MPLRDHFRKPLDDVHSWDGLHAMWPAVIVQNLIATLPLEYLAVPGVYLGSLYEIDAAAFEKTKPGVESFASGGGTALATFAPPQPTVTFEAGFPGQDVYEVRIYHERRKRKLVAAIEIVSPSNKAGSRERVQFVGKIANLVKAGICVSVVDIVSTVDQNLYADVLAEINGYDPAVSNEPPPMYAATLHTRETDTATMLDAWYYPLAVGDRLPTLPIRLRPNLSVPLELEATYEECCRTLRITE